jgi:hypothetical protein
MKFYCLKDRKSVNVEDSKVKYRSVKTRSGKRKLAEAKCPKGHKLAKFVKA